MIQIASNERSSVCRVDDPSGHALERRITMNTQFGLWRWAPWFVFLAVFFGANGAHAAPLTYNADVTFSLTSPAINFTVASGSLADELTLNATSVIVTLSSSTGGNFVLSSASRDLTIASSSAGGTVTQTCTSGVASTTISQ